LPGSQKKFAELILSLLENSDLRQMMGEAGQRRAERFSADKMAVRLEKAYNALITGARDIINNLAGEEI